MSEKNLLKTDLKEWSWLNAPAEKSQDKNEGKMCFAMDAPTDFWQKTHYGNYCADNGHFFNRVLASDFSISTRLILHPAHEYDQAGLMVRLSSWDWIKVSLEFNPAGPSYLGSVVTQGGYSDWSYIEWDGSHRELGFRIIRKAGDFTLQYSAVGQGWKDLRFCHLLADNAKTALLAGFYGASPQKTGGSVDFIDLELEQAQPQQKQLHK